MHKVVSKLQTAYDAVFDPKNQALRGKNTQNCNDHPLKINTYRGQTPDNTLKS